MIVSKTPLRISFAGGGTDFKSYYKNNEYGAVLSTSIDSYLYVTVKKQSTMFNEKYRLNYSETELVNDVAQIKNLIIRESIRFLDIDDGLYIGTISDVPSSSGLGSSSAFCVGLLNALYRYKGQSVSAGRLAEEAAYIECDVLKRPMGKQDHYAAAYGGINYIRFYDDETITIKPVNMTFKDMNKLSNSLLLFWTGICRPSESVLKQQDENNPENKMILDKMKQQAFDLSNILVSKEFSIQIFGRLLHEGWEYKKSLASKISNASINKSYNVALKQGAIGGKISGAGAGGFLALIVEPKNQNMVVSSMQKLGLIRYRFGFNTHEATVSIID